MLLSLWDPSHAHAAYAVPAQPCAGAAGPFGDMHAAATAHAHAAIAAAAHAALTRGAWALPHAPPAQQAMPAPLPEASAMDLFDLLLARHAPVC